MTITVKQLNAICERLAQQSATPAEFRLSPDGVLAVHDERFYGGAARPWSVLWIPAGHRAHWPSMSLHDQDVATWTVLRPEVQKTRTRPERETWQTDEYAAILDDEVNA